MGDDREALLAGLQCEKGKLLFQFSLTEAQDFFQNSEHGGEM